MFFKKKKTTEENNLVPLKIIRMKPGSGWRCWGFSGAGVLERSTNRPEAGAEAACGSNRRRGAGAVPRWEGKRGACLQNLEKGNRMRAGNPGPGSPGAPGRPHPGDDITITLASCCFTS